MKAELVAKLVALQSHLIDTKDSVGLKLFDDLRQDIKQDGEWEKILLWSADVEAATAEGYASRKSASRGERTRHASICKSLRGMIQAGYFIMAEFQTSESTKERVLERLDKAQSACIKANV